MKLSYWYSKCPNDSEQYSVRTRTKREAASLVTDLNSDLSEGSEYLWQKPIHVTVEYQDGFDLMFSCLSDEGGAGCWETGLT